MQSVWQETLLEHEARLSAYREKYQALQRDEEGGKSLEYAMLGDGPGRSLGGYRHGPDLEKARKCLEQRAAAQYHTPTRLRSWQDFGKAGIPQDSADFYQDARLRLVVRFDEAQLQFVAMTWDEYAVEWMDQRHRHAQNDMKEEFNCANQDAQRAIQDWNTYNPCNTKSGALYRRGPCDSFYKKTEGGSELFRKSADDWQPGHAILLLNPHFKAVQITENKPQVRVTLHDGETEITSWEGGPPSHHGWGQKNYAAITFNRDTETIGLLPCPPALYVAHLEAVGGKPIELETVACTFEADAQEFVAALKHATVAASDDPARPVLCAVLLTWTDEGGNVNLVSTDTYRLLLQEVVALTATGKPTDALLPRAFCSYVAATLKKSVGHVHISIGTIPAGMGSSVAVTITGQTRERGEVRPVQLLSLCEEGQFVNYNKFIPKTYQRRAVLDPAETVRALKDVAAVAKEDNDRTVWNLDRDGVFVAAHQYQTKPDSSHEALAVMEPIDYEGDPLEIAMNGKYVRDYLEWQKSPVTLELCGPLNSMAFVNGSSRYILMPMRVM